MRQSGDADARFPLLLLLFSSENSGGKGKMPGRVGYKNSRGKSIPALFDERRLRFFGCHSEKTLPHFSYVKYIPQVYFLPPSHLCSFPDNFDKIKRIKVRFSPFRPWHFCHPRAKADFSSFLSRSTTKRCQLDTEEENSKCHLPPRRRFGFFSPSYRAGKHA